jgi:hypothetical protein
MKEIMSLSGAKITISERAERGSSSSEVAAASNEERLVTITGSPAAAQTAHILITQRLQLTTGAQSQQQVE